MPIDFCTRSSKEALPRVVACAGISAASAHTSRDARIIPALRAPLLPDEADANKDITPYLDRPAVFNGHRPEAAFLKPLGGGPVRRLASNYKNGHIQRVANWINCIPKDQIFQPFMSVSAHD